MSSAKSTNLAKDLALIALSGSDAWPGDMLEDALRYCFDQLCWRRTTNELDAIIKDLAALIEEDA